MQLPANISIKPVKVHFLEMHHPPAYTPIVPEGVTFHDFPRPTTPSYYRQFYYGVGAAHHWLDRMVMADDELREKINANNVILIEIKVQGEPAGYLELVKEEEFVEILYFGLLPTFTGKGLGFFFLQWAVMKAWSYSPKWVQLNTCELDHPRALGNYQRAGFEIVKMETQDRRIGYN